MGLFKSDTWLLFVSSFGLALGLLCTQAIMNT